MSDDLYFDAESGRFGYAGRKEGWHRRGNGAMTEDSTKEDWKREACMDHEIIEVPVRYEWNGREMVDTTRKGLLHGKAGHLINIVGKNYHTVQPGELVDFYRAHEIETAGVLGNGGKYWAMGKLGENFRIEGDEVAPHFLIASSADGSLATYATPTFETVVCANTLAMAIAAARGVKMRHSRRWDPDLVAKQIGLLRDNAPAIVSEYEERLGALTAIDLTRAEVARFLANVVQDQKALEMVPAVSTLSSVDAPMFSVQASASDIVEAGDRKLKALWDTYNTGPNNGTRASNGTLYGAVQAVTRHVDHVQGRSEDTRRASAMFGAGNNLKNRAVSLAEDLAIAA